MAITTQIVDLAVADETSMRAYVAEPEGPARAGIIVFQEIFGVNHHIRDIAERFARDGLDVVLADVDEGALKLAADRVAGLGVETLPVVTDVSDAAAVTALASAALERFGAVHVVCNNAGVASMADPWFGPISTWPPCRLTQPMTTGASFGFALPAFPPTNCR